MDYNYINDFIFNEEESEDIIINNDNTNNPTINVEVNKNKKNLLQKKIYY